VRREALLSAGACLLIASIGCARRPVPPLPESEDYVFPAPAAGELAPAEADGLRAAWNDVLVADTASAGRRLAKLRKRAPGRASLDTAAAYSLLRAGRADEAAPAFESVLQREPSYLPALVGAGSTALHRGDADAALDLYRRAQAKAPGDPLVRKRLAAVKLQVTDRHIGRAQAAAEASDLETAAREYRGALAAAPEVAGLRLSLAEVLLQQEDPDGALAVLAADPTRDRQVRLRLGGVLLQRREYARAEDVYAALLARDPGDAAARAGLAATRDAVEAATMPEEYRRIPGAERVTRADLAALLLVRVKALRRAPPGEPKVAVDISGSWAREQITSALALDLLELYPNHTFQPGATVRRVDLARAVARVLERVGWPLAAAPVPADMTRAHLDFDAVERVLGAGLMALAPSGAFEPWRPVTGREALDVVDSVARLIGS
jgi:thioredoxin-like negative regulator of GroEL